MLDNEIDQEEFYNLQMQSWSRFYASAVQYDQVAETVILRLCDIRLTVHLGFSAVLQEANESQEI